MRADHLQSVDHIVLLDKIEHRVMLEHCPCSDTIRSEMLNLFRRMSGLRKWRKVDIPLTDFLFDGSQTLSLYEHGYLVIIAAFLVLY